MTTEKSVDAQMVDDARADVQEKAGELAELLIMYYRTMDKAEGGKGIIDELRAGETVDAVKNVFSNMIDGLGAFIAMYGEDMVNGQMLVVGRDKSSPYNMMQLALYMRETSNGIIGDIRNSVPPDVAARVDAAVEVCDANSQREIADAKRNVPDA